MHSRGATTVGRQDRHEPLAMIVVRWIAFIPLGILVGVLWVWIITTFVIGGGCLISRLIFGYDPLVEVFIAIGLGAAPVLVGALIAPAKRKLAPAVIMASLLSMLSVSTLVQYVVDREWWMVAQAVAMILAAIGMVVLLRHKGDDPNAGDCSGASATPDKNLDG